MKPRFGVLTGVTVALLALFGVVDAAAHFTHYAHGETFSAFIWSLEGSNPLVFYPLIGGLIIVLFTHLIFRKP
jgi:hypothetical protein